LRTSVIRRIERLEINLKPLAPRVSQVDFGLLVESEQAYFSREMTLLRTKARELGYGDGPEANLHSVGWFDLGDYDPVINDKVRMECLEALDEKERRIVVIWSFGSSDEPHDKYGYRKLQNPRLQQISFHTLRHWKATMLYHQTKDILYVKEFLGHNKVETTLLYIQLAETIFKDLKDEFTVKVASKREEIKALLEVSFEYVCEKDGFLYLRKRK
jgi:hypothetical protein